MLINVMLIKKTHVFTCFRKIQGPNLKFGTYLILRGGGYIRRELCVSK